MTEIVYFLLAAVVIVLAVTVHEAAHGFMANYLGDPTAKLLGRLSLNPIKHIDLIGTIVVPLGMLAATTFLSSMFPSLLSSPLLFGWAKPVPVNTMRLRYGRPGMSLVAAAGPLSNLAMAIILLILAVNLPNPLLNQVAKTGIVINLSLMVINLIPILPLDGGRIVHGLLPQQLAYTFGQTERYGMFVVILLLFLGVIQKVVSFGVIFMLGLMRMFT